MKHKLLEWLKRYLPANLIATAVVLIVSNIVLWRTNNQILAVYLASIADGISYYGFVLIRDVINSRREIHKHNSKIKNNNSKNKSHKNLKKYGAIGFSKDVRNLFLEFGVGELLDTLLIRPFFLYYCPKILGNYNIGLIVGKYISDISFYVPTIISYELRKKYLKK